MNADREFTIDDLGRMMAEGFTELRKDMESGFSEVRGDMDAGFCKVEAQIAELRQELRSTNQRLDEYVSPTLADHSRRIKDLELKVA